MTRNPPRWATNSRGWRRWQCYRRHSNPNNEWPGEGGVSSAGGSFPWGGGISTKVGTCSYNKTLDLEWSSYFLIWAATKKMPLEASLTPTKRVTRRRPTRSNRMKWMYHEGCPKRIYRLYGVCNIYRIYTYNNYKEVVPRWNPLKQTIGGPRAGQRPLIGPILYREASLNQRNGSLASAGVLALYEQGHHHGKLNPNLDRLVVPIKSFA